MFINILAILLTAALHSAIQNDTKEDIGIEQQLYEIVRGKKFALNV